MSDPGTEAEPSTGIEAEPGVGTEAQPSIGTEAEPSIGTEPRSPEAGPDSGQLPPPPDLLAAPGYVARRLHHAYTAAWVRYVDPQLTGPQFAVLTAVDAYPGVEQGSLARAVALDRSTMASIVRRLGERGLITRVTPADDGRKRLLHLTEEGERTLRAAYGRARELDALLMRGVDADEQRTLLERLNRLSEHWESLVDD